MRRPDLPGTLSLVARFPNGWRWPLRDGDALELWVGSEQIGVLPATVLRELLRYQLAIVAEAGRQLAARTEVPAIRGRPRRRSRTTAPTTNPPRRRPPPGRRAKGATR
jgi:hypothetical protein